MGGFLLNFSSYHSRVERGVILNCSAGQILGQNKKELYANILLLLFCLLLPFPNHILILHKVMNINYHSHLKKGTRATSSHL